MNLLRRYCLPLVALSCLLGPLSLPTHAQIETPGSMNAKAVKLMKGGQWAEALTILTDCVQRFDANAPTLFGPQFGAAWYRKGLCELQLSQWNPAAQSFEKCYDRYANKDEALSQNPFEKMALLQWANASVGAEDWQTALDLYAKFLEERDPEKDLFQPGPLFINLAKCNFYIGEIDEGLKHFTTALKNKERYNTPQLGITLTFKGFVESVIAHDGEDKLLAFLDEYRGSILLEPYQMGRFGRLFLRLAVDAQQAAMERAALELFAMVPATEVMLEDIESILARIGDRPGVKAGSRIIRRSELEESRDELSSQLSSGDPNEVFKLVTMAVMQEQHENMRGTYLCYRQLYERYPKSSSHEDHLFNLIRTTSALGNIQETETYGIEFLDKFPESKHVQSVQRLMLTSLFYNGEYEKCVRIAAEMIDRMEAEGGELSEKPAHELCLHALGGSHYYLTNFLEAQPELDLYIEMYPEGKFFEPVLYFRASNTFRIGDLPKAAERLDEFLEKYPKRSDSIYVPFALFDRARCHYGMDEFPQALAIITRLENEMPDSEVMCMAYNLKGNIHQNQREPVLAEDAYRKALESAEQIGNRFVAAEALSYLIGMLAAEPSTKGGDHRYDDALPLIDKFWDQYSDTPYTVPIANSQVPALVYAGRKQKALDDLQQVIAQLASTDTLQGLENSIRTYADLYLTDKTPRELQPHFYAFPGVPTRATTAQVLLKLAVVSIFEKTKSDAEDPAAKRSAEATIKAVFGDIKEENDPAELPPQALIKVGDFIAATDSPREALPYYDEALSRPGGEENYKALLGRGMVLARGATEAKKESLVTLEKVLKNSGKRQEQEQALFQMTMTQLELDQFEQARESALRYLDPKKGYRVSADRRGQISLALGEAYFRMGKVEDALATFLNTSGSYRGAIRISAPATQRAMEIFWERNQTAPNGLLDRQGAYNFGRSYIDETRRLVEGDSPATDEEIEQWKQVEKLVEVYVADPRVKSKEQQAQEKR